MTLAPRDVAALQRSSDWSGVRVVVAGFGVSGYAAADNLTFLGAQVTALDETATEDRQERAELLESLGATVRLGQGSTSDLATDVDLVVTSPGWSPRAPLLAQALAREVPVWGEVELAWRLRDLTQAGGPAPWLAVTGTNGKTTTVQMLAAMLRESGLRSVAAGNVGLPLVEAVMDPTPHDVLAVELSSFQLHWTSSMRAQSAAVLNVAEDHLDWYPGPTGMADYAADKGRVYTGVERACVYNVADPVTEQLVRDAEVTEGARAIGVTLGTPAVGMLGVVDDVLADRAFVEDRQTSAAELGTVADLASDAPHFVADALAAAALARSHGVPPVAVRDALRGFVPDGHRIAVVAEVDGVTWIDDSKATNPHAAAASLAAYDPVVWVAGGLPKGAAFDELVRRHAGRLRGVVLVGLDREPLRGALRRHAPDVPVVEVDPSHSGGVAAPTTTSAAPPGGPADDAPRASGRVVMDRAVAAAAGLARPGDVVLLAPASASMDQFTDYGARGDAFAAAVRASLGQG